MPKSTSARKSSTKAARPSPVKAARESKHSSAPTSSSSSDETVETTWSKAEPTVESRPKKPRTSKKGQPRGPLKIVSKVGGVIPCVTASSNLIEELSAMKWSGEGGEEVSFHAFFNHQDSFSRFVFFPTDAALSRIRDTITEELGFDESEEGATSCVKVSDYHGRVIIQGKLSQAFKERISSGEVALPDEKTPVLVGGRIQTGKVKGKSCCFLMVDSLQLLTGATATGILPAPVAPSTSEEEDEEDEDEE